MRAYFNANFVPQPEPSSPPVLPSGNARHRSSRNNNRIPQWSFNPDAFAECMYMGVQLNNIQIRVLKFHASSTGTGGSDLATRQGQMNNNIASLTMNELKDNIVRQNTILGISGEAGAAPVVANPAQGLEGLDPNTFFDNEKNPILKSFSSTYGKGLAGVVTEFKIDYGDAKGGWGTDGVLRAPKFVTITLGMSVIHDIPLGLDSNGIMNAPIWPVGNMSRTIGGITEPSNTLTDRRNLQDPSGLLGKFKNPLINRR
jgi:hypothetical protein